jgi:hypothetical protein
MESRNIALQGTVPDPGLGFSQPRRGAAGHGDGRWIETAGLLQP